MTADLYEIKPRIVVESVDPALAAGLAWAAEHETDDLMATLSAFCAGARFERERMRKEADRE